MGVVLKNSVYNHIPKTGGGWINLALVNGIEYAQHTPGEEHIRQIQSGKIHFCFVRNPVSWYLSRWRCPFHHGRVEGRLGRPLHINYIEDAQNDKEKKCFNTWLERVLFMSPEDRYMPSKDYGECGFATKQFMHFVEISQYVGKQENLQDDLIDVLNMANETYNKRLILKTPRQHLPSVEKQYYNQDLYNEVIRLDKKIFEKYDYQPLKGYIPSKIF